MLKKGIRTKTSDVKGPVKVERWAQEEKRKMRPSPLLASSQEVVIYFSCIGSQDLYSVRIMLPIAACPSHHLSTKLVGQLLLDLLDFPCLAIVSQSPCHFLVGHFLAVTLLDAPAVCQCLFVFGGELESAFFLVYPPDAVFHVSIAKKVQKELVQTDFFLAACVRDKERW